MLSLAIGAVLGVAIAVAVGAWYLTRPAPIPSPAR